MVNHPPNPDELNSAALRCDVQAVKELLAAGHNPGAIDTDGMTPLHWAVYGGYVEIAEMLLRAGADPNARCNGTTPLWHAEDFGMPEMAALLRSFNAREDENPLINE